MIYFIAAVGILAYFGLFIAMMGVVREVFAIIDAAKVGDEDE